MPITSYHHGQLGCGLWGALGPAENTPWDYPPEACRGWNLSTIVLPCVGVGKAPPGREMQVLAARLHPGNGEGGGVWVGPLMLGRNAEALMSQGGATAGPGDLSVQGCSTRPSFTSV